MITKFTNPFFSVKIKAFLFFLILATIFWVLTRFSKQEAGVVSANIIYTNVPKGKSLLETNPQSVSFTLAANKFEILYYRLKKPTITVDIAALYRGKNGGVLVSKDMLVELLQNQINSNLIVQKVTPQDLEIALKTLNFKEVPVTIISNLKYKSGYGESGTYTIDPNKVTITGTKEIIDTITSIKTVLIEQNNIDTTLHLKVPLQVNDLVNVKVSQKEVTFKQEVVEFSQKHVTVAINIVNAPKNATLKLLPSSIEITFNVPVDNFSAITAADFNVIVDYTKRNTIENFVIPEITKIPEGVKNIKLGTNKIDLLLFK